ncbi:MAG: hypothetical protein AAF541_15190 [Pseudomonadota bacterium]
MSTTPRLESAVVGEPEDFRTVTAHANQLMGKFFELYGEFWASTDVDPRLKEITRLRNARVTDCGF